MTRVLVVGGRKAGQCRTTGQLEPRGYELARIPGLPLPSPLAPVDIVIFALPAPDTDAVAEACARLRLLAGPLTIVLCQSADPNEAARLLEAGADDCLLAPHNPREVVARVRALLRRRERSRAAPLPRRALVDGCHVDAFNLRAIDVHVSRLKKRLAQVCATDPITAYRGVGYRLDVEAATP